VSAQLFLSPNDMRLDLVRKDEKTKPYHGLKASGTTVKHGDASWTLYLDYGDTNPSGGTGEAAYASAERGKTIMDRMVQYGAEVVEEFRKIPTRVQSAR